MKKTQMEEGNLEAESKKAEENGSMPLLPPKGLLQSDALYQEKNKGTYDFIYVDADKANYWNYHKRLIDLIKVGGLIGYDNTLFLGTMAAPPDAQFNNDFLNYRRGVVMEFNKSIVSDPRVDLCQLSVGDGVTFCRRII